MRVLGIESSADETAAAIVKDGSTLLSSVTATSIDLHTKFGGIVPEVAARSHLEIIIPVIDEAFEVAACTWEDIDAIAVTYGPGLGGSLLIGVMTARTLAIAKNKPLIAINHVEAHIYANFITTAGTGSTASEPSPQLLEPSLRDAALRAPSLSRSSPSTASSDSRSRLASPQSPAPVKRWRLGNQEYTLPAKAPALPLLALIVSGGHSQLVLLKSHGEYEVLGRSLDDAVGEAFDKVAKMLGLPYPGGPSIAQAALGGDPTAFTFPKAKMAAPYDFSFSGLKTAVLRAAQTAVGKDFTLPSKVLPGLLNEAQKRDIAASFQRVALETLVDATERAFNEHSPASVIIGGGVAANKELRRLMAERLKTELEYTDIKLCTDNAAMIAALAYFQEAKKADPYSLEVDTNLVM